MSYNNLKHRSEQLIFKIKSLILDRNFNLCSSPFEFIMKSTVNVLCAFVCMVLKLICFMSGATSC